MVIIIIKTIAISFIQARAAAASAQTQINSNSSNEKVCILLAVFVAYAASQVLSKAWPDNPINWGDTERQRGTITHALND